MKIDRSNRIGRSFQRLFSIALAFSGTLTSCSNEIVLPPSPSPSPDATTHDISPYYRAITIDHSKVTTADVTNFPLFICFNATLGNGNVCPPATDLKTIANGG